MDVTISTLHCTVPAPVRQRAEEKIRRLERYEPRIISADVVFDIDHGLHRVEARMIVAGGPMIIGHGTGEDFRTALDRVTDRLARQLRRRRERRRDHRGDPLSRTLTMGGI